MNPKKLDRFWRALESWRTTAALRDEWKSRLKDEYPHVEQFLSPLGKRASEIPCRNLPACACEHSVVRHGDNDFSSVCQCDPSECPTFDIEEQDLIVLQLSRTKFAEAIVGALHLSPGFLDLQDYNRTFSVGRYNPASGEYFDVIATLPLDQDDLVDRIEAIAARIGRPLMLLTPTPDSFSPEADSIIARNRSCLMALSDLILVSEEGAIVADAHAEDRLLQFAREHVPALRFDSKEIYVPPDTQWNPDIEIVIHNGERLSLVIKGKSKLCTFGDFGLTKRKRHGEVLSDLGQTLCEFAKGRGWYFCPSTTIRVAIKQRVKRLRKRLGERLKIPGDPIVALEDHSGWRTTFRIREDPKIC